MPTLKRTQMYFPDEMLRELKKRAVEEKTSIAGIVRGAVSELFKKKTVKSWQKDSLWDMQHSSSKDQLDLSVNHIISLNEYNAFDEHFNGLFFIVSCLA